MALLPTLLDAKSPSYIRNYQAMAKTVEDLRHKVSVIMEGGGKDAKQKHQSRGKLLVRDRIRHLIDPGSAFLEFSQFAAYQQYGGDVPAAGIVTGVGVVHGHHCLIVANDATVKGGGLHREDRR